MSKKSGHRMLPHTADMGIEAWAPQPEELFVAAAQGLREMLFGRAKIAGQEQHRVRLEADNPAELLVSWLNEILYSFEVHKLAPAAFHIDSLQGGCLQATILGEAFDPERHPMQRQVKAVTYHQLILEQRQDNWYAKVYVDL